MQASFVKLNIQDQQRAFQITYHFYALCVTMACFADFIGLHCHVKCYGNEMFYCSCTIAIVLPVPSKSVPKEKQKATTLILKLSSKVGTRRGL